MSKIPDNRSKSQLDRMNERLYSRTKYHPPEDMREPISEVESEPVPSDWQSGNIDEMLASPRQYAEHHPIIRRIFFVSILFAICAAIAASLIYFNGDNFISSKNLEISIDGPVNISAGSVVELTITITNKNNATLDNVNLDILYPSGTRSVDNQTAELGDVEEKLEDLLPGDKITKNVEAIFLGREGEIKDIKVLVDYRVKGSNATFTKEKMSSLTIGSAPVTITLSRPESVGSGEEFVTTATIVANSSELLKNVILRAEYPYGFSLRTSTPTTSDKDKRVWLLGDLAPGSKKTVTLRGTLLGEDEEERTFRFFVGSGEGDGETLDTLLASQVMSVSIERPSIDLSIRLNGETAEEHIAPVGKQVQGTITLKNNLIESLSNPVLEVRITGAPLDKLSVRPRSGGFYNSTTNSIVWNESNSQDLTALAPGDSSSVSFEFASLSSLPLGSSNQEIELVVTLTGRAQGTSGVLKVSETRLVKIASEVALSAKSLYSTGPFVNRGSIPPQAEKETTYTITLSASNTRNDIEDVVITGQLGANVQWAEEVSPPNSPFISYNESNRTVTWSLDKLPSGVGFTVPSREVSFRVSLIPSLGQVGGVPVLVGNLVLTGVDSFTNSPVRVTHPAVTTMISTDPKYVQGDEIVVK